MKKTRKKVYYYDLEQFKNFHSAYFISKDGQEKYFIIHESRNDLVEYDKFLRNEVKGMIGFNNLNYDHPMIYYIMNDLQYHKNEWDNPNYINSLLKAENDRLITSTDWKEIAQWKIQIPQLDIFKVQHFDNRNNSASLKQIQFVTRQKNVQDLDLGFDIKVENHHIDQIIKYNRNDVLATKYFVEACQGEIDLRVNIKKLYSHYKGVDWMNCNDAKIGSEIFTVPLANTLNIEVKELKKLRTYRNNIKVKDIILPYINFKTETFNNILKDFKKQVITSTKNPFKLITIYKGVKFEYAGGGIHACVKAGKYYADDIYDIIDIDVK